MRLVKKAGLILGGGLVLVLSGMAYIYFAYLRPVPQFQPTGEYSIGVTNFDFEFQSEITNSVRKLNVRSWYPSDASEGESNLVSSQRMVEKSIEFYKMPEFLAVTEPSLSFWQAPISTNSSRFPVIVFNHGFGGFAEQNTSNMQELASNGYIVFSISHPGSSLLTEYADGTYVEYDPDLPAFVQQEDFEQATANSARALTLAAQNAKTAENFTQYWQGMRVLAQSSPFANFQPILRAWVEDNNAFIDAISQGGNSQFPSGIASVMDKNNIGVFGFSLGGVSAIVSSMGNDNIKAVVNLDGPFAFDEPLANINLPVPTCMLMSQGLPGADEIEGFSEINTPLMQVAENGGCVAVFKDALHMNFTDMNYISLLRLFGALGKVDQEMFGFELNNLLVNFFDRNLKGDDIEYAPIYYDSVVEYREF